MIPQEQIDQLIAEFDQAVLSAKVAMITSAYALGQASVQGGGFTQEQVDDIVNQKITALKVAAKAAVDAHDSNTMVDQQLKDMIDAITV